MLEINTLFQRLKTLTDRTIVLRGGFDYTVKAKRLQVVSHQLQDPHIWDSPEQAQILGQEHAQLTSLITAFDKLDAHLSEVQALLALASNEQVFDVLPALSADLDCIEMTVLSWELKRLFPSEIDHHDAYLDIQAGSGGTEAQDWAEMLLRMYLRWGEQHGFQVELLEVSVGEVAGIKSATVRFNGEYAYGWLRTETGIHRLVRLSPFDANKRRHTSFAAVFVAPKVDDHVEITIDPSDLRIDTYRASGAGGQHVNRTDSAVRITHFPSGLVVQCQTDRSQHKNREWAMSQLHAKLYELEKRKRQAEKQAQAPVKHDIGWGHQIRSYVLDNARIKDLRTGVESANVQAVLDGGIDIFLRASLQEGL